jgi:hypothetical protein
MKKTYTVRKGKKFYTKVAGEHGEKTVRHVGGDEVELTEAQAFAIRDRLVAEQVVEKPAPVSKKAPVEKETPDVKK